MHKIFISIYLPNCKNIHDLSKNKIATADPSGRKDGSQHVGGQI